MAIDGERSTTKRRVVSYDGFVVIEQLVWFTVLLSLQENGAIAQLCLLTIMLIPELQQFYEEVQVKSRK